MTLRSASLATGPGPLLRPSAAARASRSSWNLGLEPVMSSITIACWSRTTALAVSLK